MTARPNCSRWLIIKYMLSSRSIDFQLDVPALQWTNASHDGPHLQLLLDLARSQNDDLVKDKHTGE